jgi:tetratricopeptide (TPR) repeat protein
MRKLNVTVGLKLCKYPAKSWHWGTGPAAVGLNTMKTKLRIGFVLSAILCLPLFSRAQSLNTSNVVSVRELSIPAKAARAYEKGAELLAKKDATDSLVQFQRAIAEFKGYYEAYYEMGVADLKLMRVADAEQAFRKSVEASAGQFAPPLLGLGAILGYQGRYIEAEEVARKGLDLDPDSWSGRYYLGWILLGLKRVEEAEKSAREAVRLKPDSPEAMRLLIDIHSREKNYDALLKDLDAYLKIDSEGPTAERTRSLRARVESLLARSQSAQAAE